MAKNDISVAELLMRRSVETKKRTLGSEHPDTLLSVANLADILGEMSEMAALEARHGLEIKRV